MKTIEELENLVAKELGFWDLNDYLDNNSSETIFQFQRKMYEVLQDELKKNIVSEATFLVDDFNSDYQYHNDVFLSGDYQVSINNESIFNVKNIN